MTPDKWIWMPHAGHLCVSNKCQFHLNTYVGGYIVSTVGEYFPDSRVRDIYAQSRGIQLKGIGDEREYDYKKKIGFEEIGLGRKYETIVFKAIKAKGEGSTCCPWRQSGHELDMDGYNDSA